MASEESRLSMMGTRYIQSSSCQVLDWV
uniref:Uncharacterized protein n=1 Tax=Arundo donax TaxID=35708 RepID=A0A0A9AKS7_ARUDO